MARRKNNEDLIKDLMTHSPYGALSQAFIIQGLTHYVSQVVEEGDEMIAKEEEDKKNGKIHLISSKAWVGIAHDIQKRMDEFYNTDKKK